MDLRRLYVIREAKARPKQIPPYKKWTWNSLLFDRFATTEQQFRSEVNAAASKLFALELDVWIADDGALGAAVMHATGCGLLNAVMRRWSIHRGMKLSWRGVRRLSDGAWLGRETEEDVFAALGWPAMAPEWRDDFLPIAAPFLEEMNAAQRP